MTKNLAEQFFELQDDIEKDINNLLSSFKALTGLNVGTVDCKMRRKIDGNDRTIVISSADLTIDWEWSLEV